MNFTKKIFGGNRKVPGLEIHAMRHAKEYERLEKGIRKFASMDQTAQIANIAAISELILAKIEYLKVINHDVKRARRLSVWHMKDRPKNEQAIREQVGAYLQIIYNLLTEYRGKLKHLHVTYVNERKLLPILKLEEEYGTAINSRVGQMFMVLKDASPSLASKVAQPFNNLMNRFTASRAAPAISWGIVAGVGFLILASATNPATGIKTFVELVDGAKKVLLA